MVGLFQCCGIISLYDGITGSLGKLEIYVWTKTVLQTLIQFSSCTYIANHFYRNVTLKTLYSASLIEDQGSFMLIECKITPLCKSYLCLCQLWLVKQVVFFSHALLQQEENEKSKGIWREKDSDSDSSSSATRGLVRPHTFLFMKIAYVIRSCHMCFNLCIFF